MLSISSIDAAPWVAICVAKYLNMQFPTRLIKQRSTKILTRGSSHIQPKTSVSTDALLQVIDFVEGHRIVCDRLND
jgi:hypothetical protein